MVSNMTPKTVARLIFASVIFINYPALCGLDAWAQTSAPSADEVRAEANALITAVRQQRDQNADALAQAAAQIIKLMREIEALKAPKPDLKKEDTK